MFSKLVSYIFPILFPFRLLAWGHAGHAMIAELAMSMLSDATRVKVERILNGMTPEQAGNWMDEIRSDPQYKYTAPWHYVNIEPGGTYKPAASGDIYVALNTAYSELAHPGMLTQEKLKFDVLVLFHLCGDLMQPLHVGYGSDKGGNTYQVNYNGRGTNLHSIWDGRIIEAQSITHVDLGMSHMPKIRKVDFMEWLAESHSLLSLVYKLKGHKIDHYYLQRSGDIVGLQLRDAGALLAACSENIFSRMSNVPAGPVTPAPSAGQKPTNAGKVLIIPGTISPDQAAAHIGETVTVCSKVYGTKLLDNGPTFLNMGGEYPNNPFTAVIMFDKRSNFSYKPEDYLNGKTICVTGTIKNYKGKPEIVVDKEPQIKGQ